jgi:hypothetical protein
VLSAQTTAASRAASSALVACARLLAPCQFSLVCVCLCVCVCVSLSLSLSLSSAVVACARLLVPYSPTRNLPA